MMPGFFLLCTGMGHPEMSEFPQASSWFDGKRKAAPKWDSLSFTLQLSGIPHPTGIPRQIRVQCPRLFRRSPFRLHRLLHCSG